MDIDIAKVGKDKVLQLLTACVIAHGGEIVITDQNWEETQPPSDRSGSGAGLFIRPMEDGTLKLSVVSVRSEVKPEPRYWVIEGTNQVWDSKNSLYRSSHSSEDGDPDEKAALAHADWLNEQEDGK